MHKLKLKSIVRAASPLFSATLSLLAHPWASAQTPPATAPQVLFVVTNSQSMDANVSGAIMTGSGSLTGAYASLVNSGSTGISPVNFPTMANFTPPANAASTAYTQPCPSSSSLLCDNSPSRMNLTKQAIKYAISNYSSTMFFGLMDYLLSPTNGFTLDTSWVYFMSAPGGFTFTSTPAGGSFLSVPNPCLNYSSASSNVKSSCAKLASASGVTLTNLSTGAYMNYATSSDDPTINDILYIASSDGYDSVILTYSNPAPGNPLTTTANALQVYNQGNIVVNYTHSTDGLTQTNPTNAGYVPYSQQVMFVMRGFAYDSINSNNKNTEVYTPPSSGSWSPIVPMGGTAAQFATVTAPETNSASTSEIKSVGMQSPMAGILAAAKIYLDGLSKASCQAQAVIMVTDGLPTLDKSGNNWPPLGSAAASALNVTATFNTDGSLATTNDQALTDTIASITAMNSEATPIDTYIIGLGSGVNSSTSNVQAQTLSAMAIAGGTGQVYTANDSTSLQQAFTAILGKIAANAAVAAPIVKQATQSAYLLVNSQSSTAGSALYFSSPTATTATWDANTFMSPSNRGGTTGTTALSSTEADGHTITQLANIDAAAFNLPSSPTACVPNTATIVSYLVNPYYSLPADSSCSYLAGRVTGSGLYLSSFSTQDADALVGPPQNSLLSTSPGYTSYAQAEKNRPSMFMFTNNDGFLYSVNSTTGSLLWAWTPRNLLANYQNYASTPSNQYLNGDFAVVDAQNSANSWGSYVVGSFQSGAEHFSLQLDSSGNRSSVIYDNLVTGASAPGDKVSTLGTAPRHQIPQVVYVGNAAYHVYVVVNGSTATLYEANITSSTAPTSAALSFIPSSALYVDPLANRLYVGSSLDAVWSTVITGNASADVSNMQSIAVTGNATSFATKSPITYVENTRINGLSYLLATNMSQLTVFGIAPSGSFQPLWASTPTTGYVFNASSNSFTASSTVNPMGSTGIITDLPLIMGTTITLPVTIPPAVTCGNYTATYAFFNIPTGSFPSVDPTYTLATGQTVKLTANYTYATGISLAPGVGIGKIFPGSTATVNPNSTINQNATSGRSATGWLQK